MSVEETVECGRRKLLVATAAPGGALGVAAAVPFGASLTPSERAKAAGAPVEADISKLEAGQMMTVEWRCKPVWIIRRNKEQLDSLKKTNDLVSDPKSEKKQQPDYATNDHRSIKPEYMVMVGICTHLGCSPSEKFKTGAESGVDPEWPGGVPHSVLVAPDGRIIWRHAGAVDGDELRAKVLELLGPYYKP